MKPRALLLIAGAAITGVLLGTRSKKGASSAGKPKAPASTALGQATLTRALHDLDVTESDPRQAEYAENFGMSKELAWCAMAFATWMREAADVLDVAPPITGAPGAMATMQQLMSVGLWHPIEELRAAKTPVAPGSVIVWHRPRPDAPWAGHIAVVEKWDWGANKVTSIDGNSGAVGDRVARMTRSISDPTLQGVGVLVPKSQLAKPPADVAAVLEQSALNFNSLTISPSVAAPASTPSTVSTPPQFLLQIDLLGNSPHCGWVHLLSAQSIDIRNRTEAEIQWLIARLASAWGESVQNFPGLVYGLIDPCSPNMSESFTCEQLALRAAYPSGNIQWSPLFCKLSHDINPTGNFT